MKYLLDSNSCIAYLKGRAPHLAARLRAVSPAEVAVCAIVKAELFFGALRSVHPTREESKLQQFFAPYISLPFDDRCASEYARIRAHLTASGNPIGPNDYLIGAIALSNDLILVTHNTGEFSRVPGLRMEDWEAQVP
jgi:tRNA(fMet)-specific endonuclease VapC